MALCVLSDASGMTMSDYLRQLLEKYVVQMDASVIVHDLLPDTWARAADALKTTGDIARISCRITDNIRAVITDVAYNGISDYVQLIITSHIYRNQSTKKNDMASHIVDLSRHLTQAPEKAVPYIDVLLSDIQHE